MKLLLLDKDGTLTQPKSSNVFVQHPQDQELIAGVKEAIDRYHSDGWTIVIISNQGGCSAIDPSTGKPYKTLEEAIEEMRYCMELVEKVNVAYFCPDFEGQKCWITYKGVEESTLISAIDEDDDEWRGVNFRKPGAGMIEAAIHYESEKGGSEVLMVGDRPEDEAAALAANVRFMSAEEWRHYDCT